MKTEQINSLFSILSKEIYKINTSKVFQTEDIDKSHSHNKIPEKNLDQK